MRAGRLRHSVVIQTPTTGRDAAGGALQTVTTVATTRAHLAQATGREFWASEHTTTEYDIVASMRYRSDINEGMNLVYDGNTYEIKSIIDPTGYKRELKVLCVRHA